jgi:uncharacterized protein DUF4349
VSPLELVDDRFDKLAAELKAARPAAPDSLRARVETLTQVEPKPRRELGFRLPSRRVALAFVALALLGSFVAAGVTGLRGSEEPSALSDAPAPPRVETVPTYGNASQAKPLLGSRLSKEDQATTALLPAQGRLQRYDATLQLRVKDVDALSNATKRAMTVARALGGYVASVGYSTRKGERGGAALVLRVPVTNVQVALEELTALGTILRQQTAVLDVTRRAAREERQLAKLQAELRRIEAELDSGSLSAQRRFELEQQAAADRLAIKTLRAKHKRLLRSARLARIELRLATPASEAAGTPSRFERTLDDAGAVLVRELEILLYALVVAGPLLALGGAAIAAGRVQRRRSDRRLLERV